MRECSIDDLKILCDAAATGLGEYVDNITEVYEHRILEAEELKKYPEFEYRIRDTRSILNEHLASVSDQVRAIEHICRGIISEKDLKGVKKTQDFAIRTWTI
jgi:hypothetical protein